ncbi:uncharacterized protein PV09_07257 [Verruconis gallopava]|uniref:Uncharacterized protein n=1 Tax=Verruconis gallopava TaxID=253628 RepID=A0A0D2A412_9PEZI|nr:uncharacterized protein PV09_07257 [Verruconis gallopava]KIW01210.1 hypothetical protein PV09_07257 [Verruconis gallopava]
MKNRPGAKCRSPRRTSAERLEVTLTNYIRGLHELQRPFDSDGIPMDVGQDEISDDVGPTLTAVALRTRRDCILQRATAAAPSDLKDMRESSVKADGGQGKKTALKEAREAQVVATAGAGMADGTHTAAKHDNEEAEEEGD